LRKGEWCLEEFLEGDAYHQGYPRCSKKSKESLSDIVEPKREKGGGARRLSRDASLRQAKKNISFHHGGKRHVRGKNVGTAFPESSYACSEGKKKESHGTGKKSPARSRDPKASWSLPKKGGEGKRTKFHQKAADIVQ